MGEVAGSMEGQTSDSPSILEAAERSLATVPWKMVKIDVSSRHSDPRRRKADSSVDDTIWDRAGKPTARRP
jgi:hypothetical protein